MDLLQIEPGVTNYLAAFLAGTVLRTLMYLAAAFTAYKVVWKIYKTKLQPNRIISKEPANSQLWFEIRHSVQTMVIWGALSLIHQYLIYKGQAKIYFAIKDHSLAYYLLSIVLVILAHDTYFYWTHRLMHHPKLYKWFHTTHHRSSNPSPWAIFSFQPAEAIVQFGITFFLIFAIPCHYSVHIIWSIWLFAFNIHGHLGYELLPKGFTRIPGIGIINTTTHHAMHHRSVTSNFSLYFTIWDRLMGTLNPKYHETFEAIKNGRKI